MRETRAAVGTTAPVRSVQQVSGESKMTEPLDNDTTRSDETHGAFVSVLAAVRQAGAVDGILLQS